jgi:predicted nucleic acid-binding protein
MKRHYLMDTGIAQDYQAGRGGIRERAIAQRTDGHRIGICVPVLGELWSGVECSSSRERNDERLRHALSTLRIWPYTAEAAAEYYPGRKEAHSLVRHVSNVPMIDRHVGKRAATSPCVSFVPG